MPKLPPVRDTDWFKWLGAAAILFGAVQAYGGQSSDIKNNAARLTKLEASVDSLGAMNVRMARIEVKLDLLMEDKVVADRQGAPK